MAKKRGKQLRDDDGVLTAVVAKAANGEGSAYPVGDGWKATYYDASGKRRTKSGKTKAIAERRRDEAVAALGSTVGEDPALSGFVEWWLAAIAAPKVSASTLGSYRKALLRVTDVIGAKRVSQIKRPDVADLYARLAGEYSSSTLKRTAGTLSRVLSEAVTQDLLRRNPVQGLPIPEGKPTTAKRALSVDEVQRLIAALKPNGRYSAAIAMCFLEGVRVSEALGVAWSDVDLEAGTVTIRRAVVAPPKSPKYLGPTKTKGALGVRVLSPTTLALLRARRTLRTEDRLAAGALWRSQSHDGVEVELLNTTTLGGLCAQQHVHAAIRRACIAAGVDPAGVGTHTGRRSVISVLRDQGVAIEDIARHVGHAQTSTTAGYVVAEWERPRVVAEKAHALLDPAAGAS